MGVVTGPGGLQEAEKKNICMTIHALGKFTTNTSTQFGYQSELPLGYEVKTYPVSLAVGVSTAGEVGALTVEGLLL